MGFRWTLITGTGLFTRKSKRNVKLDPKQISYRRRGHPSCWSSYRFYSLMGDIGSKKPTRTSWEFVWIILRFLCLKIKIRDKDYSRLSLCLSFRVSLISIFYCSLWLFIWLALHISQAYLTDTIPKTMHLSIRITIKIQIIFFILNEYFLLYL